jgi:hypothetical protein
MLGSERNGRSYVLDGAGSATVEESDRESAGASTSGAPTGDVTPTGEASGPASGTAPGRPALSFLLAAATGGAVVLCVAAALVHVLLVFLHVAPPNTVSQRYSSLINGWIYPVFEQNWQLFAPDPEVVNRQILARTMHGAPDGIEQISDWVDLTAADDVAVEHDFFPSHTAQNMLRRAWTGYLDTHGTDDRSNSERALMMQEYLRNIAVDRMAAQHRGTFEAIQLQVITRPIAAPAAPSGAGRTALPPAETRNLPWWTVGADDD